jgi:UDP-glucose 4-epimerase
MKALVTGGAGCIGAELVERLAARGDQVVVLDNLSSGRFEHIARLVERGAIEFIHADVLGAPEKLDRAISGVGVVWHLSANADVKYQPGDRTDRDLEQNLLGTFHILECMRRSGVGRLVFASTSAVYGPTDQLPIPEEYAPAPVSLYGASKLGCEGLIRAFQNLFHIRCAILRLANIVGPRSRKSGKTVISDFVEKLSANPAELHILGNGRQAKSYLHCSECVDAMLFVEEHAAEPMAVYNIGAHDSVSVWRIAELVVEAMSLGGVNFVCGESETGWPGDIPRFILDSGKVNRLGWRAKLNSEAAVRRAIHEMLEGAKTCRQ